MTPIPVNHLALPVVCAVTTDEVVLDELIPELVPWFQVVLRQDYSDLARWTREARVLSVLRRTRQLGGDAKLVNPLSFALKTFKMVGILSLFEVFPTREEAIAASVPK